jgi:hypothetical protein
MTTAFLRAGHQLKTRGKSISTKRIFTFLSSHLQTTAFLRAGDVAAAIECCVALHQWDRAVRLAEQQRSGHIEALLAKYANHLLDKGKHLQVGGTAYSFGL